MAERKYQFERLTPIDNMDLDVYEEAIDYVFDNSDIKNVAISGAYSAGKSSVLASYKKNHSNLRFLHISLAHFKSPDQEDETEIKESVLEGKILNQLIHQIPSEKIPQTNFRVKKKVNTKSVIRLTIGAVLFLVSTIYFFCFDMWKNYLSSLPDNWFKTILTPSTHQYALMVDGVLMVALLSFVVYRLISVQKNKNIFRKLNLNGNEIEIFEESDDSYFDKYLNEVLYLFENADADVIVFEDMDRFNANKIFERLREVNTLANIQLQKESKKVLRFFYLLRDDIFVSKDRTKFFDYIIPVVPVVDSSNSYDQFISHLKRGGIFEKFNESFLQGLSLYIDDMRLLKNIYNEFVVYYNRLNITELDCNKMLAIVAYKNLFPRDFADLQLNQGFVYALFNKTDEFIKSEITEIEKAIEGKQNRITLSQNEHLVSMRELNVAFADKYLRNYSWSQYNDSDLSDFVMYYLHGDNKSEYMSRKQALEDKLHEKCDELNQEIINLEQMDDDLFSRDELLAILTWQISDALKITLLGFTDEEISIIGKNYSPTVCLHILSSNFAESDLHDLFSSFEQWDSSVQTKIFDYAVRYIARIIDDPNSASQKLKNNLLDSESVNRDEKIDLFIAMMPSLCENSIKEFLTLLNLTDYLKIFDTRSRPKFEINDENEKLLAAFKEANMIDNYEESSEKEGYYKITRPKPAAKTLPKELL